ncbi:MAG: hypothetical protein GXO85_02240 [Chlorobi bacterium]|nr:hypothetical protein [Chlorobiota bacterium]
MKLQNAGTTEIKIGGGWTLMPGGSIEIGNHSNCNILLQRLSVSFGTVTEVPGKAAVNRLEIMEWQINDSAQAHFDG